MASPGAIRSTLAVFDYRRQAAVRAWILALKHGGRVDLAVPLGTALANRLVASGMEADVLVPVPLHPWRRFERGYDQAWALARAAEKSMRRGGSKVRAVRALKRMRDTPPQGEGGSESRRSNVSGAFGLRSRSRRKLEGKCCYVVDDVVTSGATLAECALMLRRAGAAEVHALVLASAH